MLFLTKRLKPNFVWTKKCFFHLLERYVLCLSGTYERGQAGYREGRNVGLLQVRRPHRQLVLWPYMKLEHVMPNWRLGRSRWHVQRQACCLRFLATWHLKVWRRLCLLRGKRDGRVCLLCARRPSSMTMRARRQGQCLGDNPVRLWSFRLRRDRFHAPPLLSQTTQVRHSPNLSGV